MARGQLIAFEGIDGSGKSSTLARVVAALQKDGKSVVATREETASERGGWVRRSITEKWDPLTTTFLFVADRAQHVAELKVLLDAGTHVLCDRFLHSTLAYQGVTLQGRMPDPTSFLRGLHEGWCPLPDKVLLFKADPAKCIERVRKRGQEAPYEKAQFLTRVQDAYLAEARRDAGRFTILDAERDLEVVAQDALAQVKRWLA
jgi:dTMP kinase